MSRPEPSGSARRRGHRWWLLVVVFVALPLAEIYVIIQVGHVIGALWTILLLVADAAFGAWLVKHEGRRAFGALRGALASGRMPAGEIADGALILIGGTLMITPGFITDVLGILCVLPLTRPVGRRLLSDVIRRRLVAAPTMAPFGHWPSGGPGAGDQRGPRQQSSPAPDVVQGSVVPEEPPEGPPRR